MMMLFVCCIVIGFTVWPLVRNAVSSRRIGNKSVPPQQLMAGAVVIMAIGATTVFFSYKESSSLAWQEFRDQQRSAVWQQLFNRSYMQQDTDAVLTYYDAPFCFAMQQVWLARFNTRVDPLVNIGYCHHVSGATAHAQQAVTMALAMQPNHAEANYLWALIVFDQEQSLPPKALDRLMITLTENPAHHGALWLLFLNSISQGNRDQALFFVSQMRLQAQTSEYMKALVERAQAMLDNRTGEIVAPLPQPSLEEGQP